MLLCAFAYPLTNSSFGMVLQPEALLFENVYFMGAYNTETFSPAVFCVPKAIASGALFCATGMQPFPSSFYELGEHSY